MLEILNHAFFDCDTNNSKSTSELFASILWVWTFILEIILIFSRASEPAFLFGRSPDCSQLGTKPIDNFLLRISS